MGTPSLSDTWQLEASELLSLSHQMASELRVGEDST